MVGDHEGDIGADDQGEDGHFGLAAGGEGEDGLHAGGEVEHVDCLDEDQGEDDQDEAIADGGNEVAADLREGDAGVFAADGHADEELRGPNGLGRGAVSEEAELGDDGRHDQRAEDGRAEHADPFGTLPAEEAAGNHEGQFLPGDGRDGHARRVAQVGVPDPVEDEGEDRDDDQDPCGVDEREGAGVAAGLFSENQHVLEATGHGGVIGGGEVIAPKALEIGDAKDADDGDHHGDQDERGPHSGEGGEDRRCQGRADRYAQDGAHRVVDGFDPFEADAKKCPEETGGDGAQKPREWQVEEMKERDTGKGDGEG